MKSVEFYQGNPKVVDMRLLTNPGNAERELEKDTMAIYQVADDLYIHQRYRIDAGAAVNAPRDVGETPGNVARVGSLAQ
jgi:hypothetical protein